MIKIATITLLTFSLTSCLLFNKTNKAKSDFGKKNIQYYANKTVSSLEVPPDLTQPNSKDAFKLSKYVSNIQENMVTFSDDKPSENTADILPKSTHIEIKKLGQIRWLIVDKKSNEVWDMTRSFFTQHGFIIKKSDKKIGVMETNFLENNPDLPSKSIGFIRSMLKKVVSLKHTLPSVDKYRVRIEPTDNGKKTEVYLTLNSMKEVVTNQGQEGENTIWQVSPKDWLLETEMLYQLMTHLGGNRVTTRKKINTVKQQKIFNVRLAKGVAGYAKLKFSLGEYETWENIGWALDQLNVDIEDSDIGEGSFYVNLSKTENIGFLSHIFGDTVKKSFQISVKKVNDNLTEVHFNDLSEINSNESVNFSYEFFGKIAKQFKDISKDFQHDL